MCNRAGLGRGLASGRDGPSAPPGETSACRNADPKASSASIDAGGIARIVIDRPAEHNTLSAPAGAALAAAIDEVVAAAPRVVLLTGTGPVFCAGGDIGEFQAHAGALDALVDRILNVLHPALARLAALPVPVVTALNGSVGGAGVGLALCGDFALAAASMKLRTGYAAIGLSPDAGASWFLARRAGALRARQLFFTSETLDASRCLSAGIVDAVYANDRLLPEAEALCAPPCRGRARLARRDQATLRQCRSALARRASRAGEDAARRARPQRRCARRHRCVPRASSTGVPRGLSLLTWLPLLWERAGVRAAPADHRARTGPNPTPLPEEREQDNEAFGHAIGAMRHGATANANIRCAHRCGGPHSAHTRRRSCT